MPSSPEILAPKTTAWSRIFATPPLRPITVIPNRSHPCRYSDQQRPQTGGDDTTHAAATHHDDVVYRHIHATRR